MSGKSTPEVRERYANKPVPPGLKHGKESRARRFYKCGCPECLPSGKRRPPKGEGQTWAERDRKLRHRKRGTPVPEGTKHGVYAYRTYGCLCDVCRAAAAEKRKTAPKPEKVTADGLEILHWPPRGIGMWECPVCEAKLPMRGTL